MDFRGHCAVAMLTFALFALAIFISPLPKTPATLIFSLLACFVGANLPDLDIKTSKPHRYAMRVTAAATAFFLALLVVSVVLHSDVNTQSVLLKLTVISVTTLLVVFLVSRLPHRGPTHGVLGISAYALLLLLITLLFGFPLAVAFLITLAGVAGYASHILADEASTFFKKKKSKRKRR
ncbi:metal-dependent hydrolase [Candidatus Alkanophaga liquidiphilum]|nr:MAG: hypothetical protein DRN91_07220 [Candidatus Alkanophagales archaeon]